MSRWKSRLLRGGLVAGTSVLAAGAIASPAIGAGVPISGYGASLQGAAQTAWLSGTGSWPAAANFIGGTASGSYTSGSSSLGLRRFSNDGSGLGSPLQEYIGTDDPPTATQNGNALAASGTRQITIPVTQAPVAVVVSVPSTISGVAGQRLRLTNRLLEETFRGRTADWGTFLTAAGVTGATGAGLTSPIELQVRGSGSGTSYAFKNYLTKVNPTDWSAYDNGNVSWPSAVTTANCGVTQTSGSQLVSAVATDVDGSIGYANLADVVAGGFTNTLVNSSTVQSCQSAGTHAIAYASVQNNGSTTPATFADPIHNGRANTNPGRSWTNATGGSTLPGVYDSWFGVSANDPRAGSTGTAPNVVQRYGILAATYALAWDDYGTTALRTAYGASWADKRDTVKNYLQYVVSDSTLFATDGGQNLLASTSSAARYYAPLPTAVRTAADTAADNVG